MNISLVTHNTDSNTTSNTNSNVLLFHILSQIFGTYPFLNGENLTPNVAFVSFVLLNLIVDPLYNLPVVLSNLVNAIVSTRRLQTFFLAPEIGQKPPEDTSADKDHKEICIVQPRLSKVMAQFYFTLFTNPI